MKTQTRFLTATAFAAALLGSAASASAAGLSPVGQFANTSVALRTDVETSSPRAYAVGADAVTTQPVVVKAHKAQAPSSYELHSMLVRSPVKPEVVRAQGE